MTQNWRLDCKVQLIKASWNFTSWTFIISLSLSFQCINESSDTVSSLKTYNNWAKRWRIACKSSDSTGKVIEWFGKSNFVLWAKFAIPCLNINGALVCNFWHISHLSCNRGRIGCINSSEHKADATKSKQKSFHI